MAVTTHQIAKARATGRARYPTSNFDHQSEREAEWGEWQPGAGNRRRDASIGGNFCKAAHQENAANEQATREGQKARGSVHGHVSPY